MNPRWARERAPAFRLGLVTVDTRAGSFAIIGSVAAVNGFAGKIATEVSTTPLLSAILNLGGVSAIVWFAIGTLFIIAHEEQGSLGSNRYDTAALLLTLLLSFMPLNFAGAIALLICGAYLAATSSIGSIERRMAIIVIALTGPLIWGRFLLALFGPFLLGLDARMAAALAGVAVHGNVVSLRDGSGSLYVALGCSSVHNMSLAILFFVALVQMMALRCTPALILSAAGATLAMAAVNVMRLAAMARFPQYFDLLHTGWGGTAFGAVSFVAAGAIIVRGVRVALCR
jgi:hypothetical protein